jgi:hypothetical protein
MKKNLLFVMCMATGISAFAQFTPGNLAVYRYGNGTDALANGIRVPVFVDEYNPTTGSKVNTIAIPQTASGANYGLEGLGLTTGGTFEAEGFPVLSRDGFTLSIIGHNPEQAGEFVIGTLNAAGTWTANTIVPAADGIGAPRSAVVEGTSVYFNGYQNGVRYKTLGTNTASARVSQEQNAPRVLTIGQTIYGTTTANKIFAPTGTSSIPQANLPTTQVIFSIDKNSTPIVPSIPGSAPLKSAHQVIAFKTASDRTLIYVLDDGYNPATESYALPLIKKYRSNSAGNDWVAFGSITVPANTKSLTGTYDSATGVKLYFTTYGEIGVSDSKLYMIDNPFTVSTEPNSTANLSGTPTLIATAPANTTFRGVTLAPIANPLPVTLTSFDAKESQHTIKLNWATSSEINSSHFDVLKSYDGKEFLKIGEVKAVGISDTHRDYSFVDENPFPGVNYYQLQQFDKNGTTTFYGPKQVTSKVQKTDFSIYASASKAAADLFVYSTIRQQGKIRILSIGGQVLFDENLALEKGYSKITLPANFIKTGVQVALLNAQSETITKKFIWQQ